MYIFPFTIAVLASTLGYVIYLLITSSGAIKDRLSPRPENNTNHILFQRLTGIIIFGVIPALLISSGCRFSLVEFGITPGIGTESVLWILFLSALIIPMNYFTSGKPENLAMYPQIRNREWTPGLYIVSSLSWITYLLAYEMLFRGFLLFPSLEILGYWPAILLNTGIYSLVHYPKGYREALGAAPFGLVLCILTIRTGNIWIAFTAHAVLALSNEWFSLWRRRNNP